MSVCGQAEEERKQTTGKTAARKRPCQCTDCHMFKLTELTPLLNCRRLLKAVSCHHRSSSFVPSSAVPTFVPPAICRKRSPNFFTSALIRNPSRCFVKRSAVLFFVSTRLTDRRFTRIHCCIDKHRISMCLSPPGLLRCRMCLAESGSLSVAGRAGIGSLPQQLRTQWHQNLLSDFITHSSCRQGRNIVPMTKSKLSSLCNCVGLCFVWILSGKNSVPVSAQRSLQYPC